VAETLKTFFSASLVRRLAADLARVHRDFPVGPFVKDASAGLDSLELLDRGRHIARALGVHLPQDYPEAVEVLIRSLGPEYTTDELVGAGMAPFFYLPHTVFVAERGLEHFDLSMRAQYELTKRFSAESSIRPYIARDPERVLALLELLKDDASTMVRRSVANSLNDLGKVRPDLLIHTAAAWLEGGSLERRALVEHGLRSAVKRGDLSALRLLGFGNKPSVSLEQVRFTPDRVRIGGRVAMSFALRSTSRRRQELLVDVAVHFVKARGSTAARVFKLARLALPPRQRVQLQKVFSLKVHTTRVPQPGRHAVDVIVNGTTLRAGTFTVLAPAHVPGSSLRRRPNRTR
jgi:3-methyladenine DNA glycosylase AlkC